MFDWVTDRLALRLIWSKCCLITFVSHGWASDLLCRFVTAFHCRSELQFFSLTSTDDTINLRHNGDKMLSEVVFLFFIQRNFTRSKVFTEKSQNSYDQSAEAHFAPKNTLLLGTFCFSRVEHTWQPNTLGKVTIYSSAHLAP